MKAKTGIRFERPLRLDDGWKMAILPANRESTPRDALASGSWAGASVPGTAAQALGSDVETLHNAAMSLHQHDVWYFRELTAQAGDRLRFEGLATIAEIWLDDCKVAVSQSMFLPLDVDIDRDGTFKLAIAFRSLDNHLKQTKGKRARWRTSLVNNQSLRFVRTTFLGHMPGWCPPIDIVGPYRPISLIRGGSISVDDILLKARYARGSGWLDAEIKAADAVAAGVTLGLRCNGQSTSFTRHGDMLRAQLSLPNIEPWWPHTHGMPKLHDATLQIGDVEHSLGRVGFRSLEIQEGADGSRFGFVINDERIFARGSCWTPADIVSLPCDKATYLRELELMRDAGFNMVRIPGITLYEAPAFYEAADELGIMVWQDLQLANFDYPFADQDFRKLVENEVETFVHATQSRCSLVALCGGSEIAQQAAMTGLPQSVWANAFLEDELQKFVHSQRPDITYIANSPFGGGLPFSVNAGVAHYYGVGAYMRPLDDARRADVSFAAECLAFANVPDPITLRQSLACPPVHHPDWKSRVPRDRGVSWDFEDVREYYMKLLYQIECSALRRENAERYLAFARAAPAEVIEATYAEWRRPQSRTDGALVFLWKDLWAGAGWGLVDSTGRPKSVWYAMKRACRPVQILMSDEGVNGLRVHALNETRSDIDVQLSVECLKQDGRSVASGERALRVPGSGYVSLTASELFGAFFDANYAYKFGPLTHDCVVARMCDALSGDILAEAFHFPAGRGRLQHDLGLEAELIENDGAFTLAVSSKKFAQTIAIDEPCFLPMENYFHLVPGQQKLVALRARNESGKRPEGSITALNGLDVVHY